MIPYLRFSFAIAVGLMFFPVPQMVSAQQSTERIEEIAKLTDRNVVATVHIPQFQYFFDQLAENSVFLNKEFIAGIDLVLDQPGEFAKKWERCKSFLNRVEQLHLLVWNSKSERPEFTILCELESIEESERGNLGFVEDFLVGENVPNETLDGGKSDSNGFPVSSIESRQHGDWLVVGNSKERVGTVIANLESQSCERHLFRDRRFASALYEFKQQPKASIFAFLRPQHFEPLFSESRGQEERAVLEKLNELSSAGMTVELTGTRILTNSFIAHTVPSTGIARHWESADALPSEYPAFCFEIRGVEAKAWDNEVLKETSRENYDAVHGKGKFDEALEKAYEGRIEKLTDLFDRSSVRYFIRYKTDLGLRRSIVMDKIDDYDAMKRHLETLVAGANEKKENVVRLEERPKSDPEAIVFGESLESRKRKWKGLSEELKDPERRERVERQFRRALEHTGKSADQLGIDLLENDSWVLTNEWLFAGDCPDIFKLIDALNEESDRENLMLDLESRVDWIAEANGQGMPSQINSGSNLMQKVTASVGRVLKLKYGERNKKLLRSIFSGATYVQLQEGKKGDGDLSDICCYLLCKSFIDECEDIVVLRFEKETGGKLRKSTGVFFRSKDE